MTISKAKIDHRARSATYTAIWNSGVPAIERRVAILLVNRNINADALDIAYVRQAAIPPHFTEVSDARIRRALDNSQQFVDLYRALAAGMAAELLPEPEPDVIPRNNVEPRELPVALYSTLAKSADVTE